MSVWRRGVAAAAAVCFQSFKYSPRCMSVMTTQSTSSPGPATTTPVLHHRRRQNLLKVSDFSFDELMEVLDVAEQVKDTPSDFYTKLQMQSTVLIQEPERAHLEPYQISFAVAMTELGGSFFFHQAIDTKHSETLEDVSLILGHYVRLIVANFGSHESVQRVAKKCHVPVISSHDDECNPCQVISDLFTIREHKRRPFEDISIAFLGSTSNGLAKDLVRAACMLNFKLVVCEPESPLSKRWPICSVKSEVGDSFWPDSVNLVPNPLEAVEGADVVYTDSWMTLDTDTNATFSSLHADGYDAVMNQSLPFQVTASVMSKAKPDAIFMHSSPFRRDFDVTAEVLEGPQSIAQEQAKNRLHVQKALMLHLLNA